MLVLNLIHKFLNLAAPPFTFFSLFFFPPFYLFQCFSSHLISIFSENVNGKVIVITGAPSGIGDHLAYEYAKRGARLALVARRENSLREVVDRAGDRGSPDVLMICADISKVDDCKRIVDETVNHFGRLDHLVNNAGITSFGMLLEEVPDITNFRTIMDTNFWCSVYTTRFATPHLNSKGKIVVLSCASSWLAVPRQSIYNVFGFVSSLRLRICTKDDDFPLTFSLKMELKREEKDLKR